MGAKETELATFAGGCFWCTEAVFSRLRGVEKVIPGYTGGHTPNPTYEEVCTGTTGHAEAIQITFNPRAIDYNDLLRVFWQTHDPTKLNRQGPDVGSQYRSAIFHASEDQRNKALKSAAQAQQMHRSPIVTEIVPLKEFYPAESYHLNYYAKNPQKPYCRLVIDPKILKLQKDLPEYL